MMPAKSFRIKDGDGVSHAINMRFGDNELLAFLFVARQQGMRPNKLVELISAYPDRPSNLSRAVREYTTGTLLAEWEGAAYEISSLAKSRKVANIVFGLDEEGIKTRTNFVLSTVEWTALKKLAALLDLPANTDYSDREGNSQIDRVIQFVDSTRSHRGKTRTRSVREFLIKNLIEQVAEQPIDAVKNEFFNTHRRPIKKIILEATPLKLPDGLRKKVSCQNASQTRGVTSAVAQELCGGTVKRSRPNQYKTRKFPISWFTNRKTLQTAQRIVSAYNSRRNGDKSFVLPENEMEIVRTAMAYIKARRRFLAPKGMAAG